MIKSKKVLVALSGAFVLIEAALAVLLQTAQGVVPFNLRYTAIIVATLFVFVFFEKTKVFVFSSVALVLTLCADYFLVYLTDMKQLPAMYFFSLVHLAYFLSGLRSLNMRS